MIYSIATVSISGALEEKIKAIAAAGFKAIEIFENDLVCSNLSPEQIRAMIEDLGLRCIVYQPFRDFEGLVDEPRRRAFDRAERKFDLMRRLGTDLLMVCSSLSPLASGDHNRIAADFHELGVRAASRGLRVAYEALSWGRHVNDHRDAWSIVKAADHPAVGMVLDSFHSLARKIPTDSIITIDPQKIFLVQLADAALIDMDYLAWSRHLRCMPGQGEFKVAEYVAALQRIGYQGPLSLEIFNDQFRSGLPLDVAREGLRSLMVVGDDAAIGQGYPRALPPRAICHGIAFVEFTAAGDDAVRLAEMFTALGFRRSGEHRTRRVSRWRQGNVNFIINEDSTGFAHSFDIVHGASICALGLNVDQAAPTLERARRLGVGELVESSALCQMGIPALRGPDGGLVYLVDADTTCKLWADEFVAVAEDPGEDAGILAVDHLAATVLQTEFLSWISYWTSLFDLVRTPQMDVLDLFGVVQSQAIEARDGALRLTINSSAGRRTLASRFVDAFWGAGYQHLALATDDIFATARKFHDSGLPILPIPANYYDDLEARLGLAPELLAMLRASNIVYDVDASGNSFYQLYSRAFDKRFFFEIVQRDHYAGYGAVNAQTRLAAQARYRVNEQNLAVEL